MTTQHMSQAPRPSEREIREAVVDRYGARARAALEGAGDAADGPACCEPEGAPSQAAPLQFITLGDASRATSEADGQRCGVALYGESDLAAVPEAAQQASAGCGNPVAVAALQLGEAVLDLGSGGGIDCFFAAEQVGGGGEVWGLDMTPQMVQLARHNAEQIETTNVRFRLGEIEDIPFDDERFDVVISNCVINLSLDKPQVFREAARVLRPGGRLLVSDMVLTRPLAPEQRFDAEQWAGCIAGALPLEEYTSLIREAGLMDVTAEFEDEERGIASAYVSAVKPT